MRRLGGKAARRLVVTMVCLLALAVARVGTAQAQEVKTIKPGMTQAEVVAAWGDYLTARKASSMLYMYFKNDCLKSCGTYDVVFFENGQVVDAVVRDSHRAYDGVASSPKDRKPEPTVH